MIVEGHSHEGEDHVHYHEIRMEDDPRFSALMVAFIFCFLILAIVIVVQCVIIRVMRRKNTINDSKVQVEERSPTYMSE